MRKVYFVGATASSVSFQPEAKPRASAAAAAAAAAAASCFAKDSLITLVNRKRIPIQHLQPGHKILTTNGFTLLTTEMMMMLDKNTFGQSNTIPSHTHTHIDLTLLFSSLSYNRHRIWTQA